MFHLHFHLQAADHRIAPYMRALAVAVTALAGAVLAIWLFAGTTLEVQGLTFRVSLAPAQSGATVIALPPFGTMEAHTHSGPVNLVIQLEQIQTETLRTQLEAPPADHGKLVTRLRDKAENSLAGFALRQIGFGLLGAFLLVLILWRPKWWESALYALGSVFLLVIILFAIFRQYDLEAFREPEYQGTLSMAPAVARLASNSLADFQEFKDRTDEIVNSIKSLFSSADSLLVLASPDQPDDVVKVLVVSDLHSNPVGVELIKTLTQHFQADFIVNAGDLTDLGSLPETSMTGELATVKIPHLFSAGNHDTPEIQAFIGSLPGGQVLNGEILEINGLKVIGFADPLAGSSRVTYDSKEEEAQAVTGLVEKVRFTLEGQVRPDILVIHNPVAARESMTLAPLVITGHNHQLRVEQKDNSVLINPGTTGAAGLRGLYSETGASYSALVVYIKPGQGALALDMIRYNPGSQQFSLERRLLGSTPDSSYHAGSQP